jgi:hypothetical protein
LAISGAIRLPLDRLFVYHGVRLEKFDQHLLDLKTKIGIVNLNVCRVHYDRTLEPEFIFVLLDAPFNVVGFASERIDP